MKFIISIYAERQFIEFALQTQYIINNNFMQLKIFLKKVLTNEKSCDIF